MFKGAVLVLFLMTLMLASQSGVQMQKATATPPPDTNSERAILQATLESLQTQVANIEATITALDAQTDVVESDDEWRVLEGDGVSLRAPMSWLSMDMDAEAIVDQFDQLESSTLDFEALEGYLEMAGDSMVLFAINVEYSTFEFATSLNVLAVDMGMEMPLNLILQASILQLTEQVRNVDGEVIELNGEDVGRVYSDVDINGMNIRQVQFIFVRDTSLYVITFGTTKNLFDELEDEFHQIAATFTTED